MRADHLEQAADEAVGRPVGEADAAAASHHAQQLAGRADVVGREHDAERRQRDVEARIREGQGLGVGDLERDVEVLGAGALASLVEQGGHVVRGGHLREAARGGQRGVAVAGGHVEHALAGAQVHGLGERFADDLQRGADDGEIAAGPRGLLALLDGREVRGGRGGGSGL